MVQAAVLRFGRFYTAFWGGLHFVVMGENGIFGVVGSFRVFLNSKHCFCIGIRKGRFGCFERIGDVNDASIEGKSTDGCGGEQR